MSIKPILNDTLAPDNKSLNLYANSLTANEINADINSQNITCDNLTVNILANINNLAVGDTTTTENLTATDVVNLRNNIIPSNTSNPNDILSNVDGAGALAWVSSLPRMLGTATVITTNYPNVTTPVWQTLAGTNTISAGSFPIGSTIEMEVMGRISFAFPSPAAITPSTFTFNFGGISSLTSNDLTFATSPATFSGTFKMKIQYTRVDATSLNAIGFGHFTNTNGNNDFINFGGGAVVTPYDELQSYNLTLDFTNGYTTTGGNFNNWNCFCLNIKQTNL